MKRQHLSAWATLVAVLALTWTACSTCSSTAGLDSGYDHKAAIAHTWQLRNIVEVDKLVNPEDTLNVNAFMLGANPANLTINNDNTFNFTPNDSQITLDGSGTWAFDDENYPSEVVFTSTSGSVTLKLVNSVRPFDTRMNLGLVHCNDSRFIVKYAFSRQ